MKAPALKKVVSGELHRAVARTGEWPKEMYYDTAELMRLVLTIARGCANLAAKQPTGSLAADVIRQKFGVGASKHEDERNIA